jgi:hypothetical protein
MKSPAPYRKHITPPLLATSSLNFSFNPYGASSWHRLNEMENSRYAGRPLHRMAHLWEARCALTSRHYAIYLLQMLCCLFPFHQTPNKPVPSEGLSGVGFFVFMPRHEIKKMLLAFAGEVPP